MVAGSAPGACPTHPVSLVLYSLLMKQAAWRCTLSRQSTSCFKYGSHTVWLYSSKDLIRAMYAKHRHFWGQFRRFCWRKQVSILLCYRCLRCRQSSAKSCTVDFTVSGKSFVWHRKSKGPNTVLWGTPESTATSSGFSPCRTTLILRLVKKFVIHVWMRPQTP